MPSIASQVFSCVDAFQTLIATGSAENQLTGGDSRETSNLSAAKEFTIPGIEDELARFKVWVANIGAHRSGRSSLDFRLRDTSKIRLQVLQLLRDLSESLTDGKYSSFGVKDSSGPLNLSFISNTCPTVADSFIN